MEMKLQLIILWIRTCACGIEMAVHELVFPENLFTASLGKCSCTCHCKLLAFVYLLKCLTSCCNTEQNNLSQDYFNIHSLGKT